MRVCIGRHGISFQFMLDGDIPDITASLVAEYFSGDMRRASPPTSCALKHLFVYGRILAESLHGALILEDDAILNTDFSRIFNAAMREARERKHINPDNLFISFENSGFKYVPHSERRAGVFLYRRDEARCAAAYYISRGGASAILSRARLDKINIPIDLFLSRLFKTGCIEAYWCHPCIVEQGSHNGKFASMIGRNKKGLPRRISWAVQCFYKERFRSRFK